MKVFGGLTFVLSFNCQVIDNEILHRVGTSKIKGLQRTGDFDGSSRTWYEFRKVRYTEVLERFDYPKYLDPVRWDGDYDATQYGSTCPDGYGGGDDEDCLFLNILMYGETYLKIKKITIKI